MTRLLNDPVRGVLLGDQGSSAIPDSGKVLLLVDLNGDGDSVDPGERQVFFDANNESGLPSPSENVFTIHQASDRSVYVGDGDTDAVYRLFDRNGDGDANDAGEATVWFSEAGNAAGFTLPTPNGIAEGPDGAIYIVNAGVSSRPQDAIYRTVDLNGDGDANDAGEATLWADLQAIVATSSPFDLSFIGDTAYLIDPSGGAEDTIFALRDADGSGTVTPDEVTAFATKTATGAPIDFTQAADGDSILVWEWVDRDGDGHSLVRFTDRDGSGAIDQPDETVEVWNSNQLPGVFETFAGFSVAADGEGRVVLTSNGSTPFGKNVCVLTDLDGDGDYFDAGEANILASNAFDPTTLLRPRALEFYEGPVQPADTTVGGGNHFSLFLDAGTNTLYAAGENILGQLGQGVTGFDVPAPLPVVLPDGFDETIVSVSAGLIHGAFLTEAGDLWTWGFGNFGRLGLGDEENRLVPTKVTGELDEKTVVVVDLGNGASYAITADGALYAWGQNSNGQLGLGDEEERLVPTRVEALAGKTVVAVSSGTSHTLALTADGEVYGWGSNVDGQVGDPTAVEPDGDPVREILSPVKVEGLPDDIVAVTADTQTSYAVTSDGRVFGWGENSFGQLLVGADNGDGTFTPGEDKILSPVELTGLPGNVVDVKGGARWAVALTEDGDVWAWGPNDEGPTGGLDGDPAAESDGTCFPVKIAELDAPEIVEIATGPNHVIAVAADGTVYTWGSNSDGRLGYPTDGPTTVPAAVDLEGDAAPYLLTATPGDGARDVAAGTAVQLVFTEEIVRGTGEIRFVNRDDPDDVLVVDVRDPLFVEIDGRTATVTPSDFFRPNGRYAVEIDEGAFEDTTGNETPGIAPGDTSTFDFRISSAPLPGDLVLRGTDEGELLRGSDGDDRLRGEGGDDFLAGNAGDDTLVGEDGDDRLSGGEGDDRMRGGDGDDGMAGGDDGDTMAGGGGDDAMRGGAGDDRMNGGRGGDRMLGDAGDDTMSGGGGSDSMTGGDGDDVLEGDRGDDTMEGGSGEDVFVYGRRGGDDVIVDFESRTDTVDVTAFDLTLSQGRRLVSQDSGGVTIDFGREGSLRLEGVSISELSPNDFLL